ncbi:hypothetical protein Clacol_003181 [Clathrus columnatus]|uniref:Nucleoside phosphorylase domain-containing protein n=1 Tax=Clathrus columnatus TaxID=1419009 RepID=A0AAV5A8S4_9AGAM|nr:hypothetical protein Clacol_003181 [Clathrus columnatus]
MPVASGYAVKNQLTAQFQKKLVMKDQLLDANFPKTSEGRVYHLGVKVGEVANRIITVGPPSRAKSIAKLLSTDPPPFILESERGFLTITGLYNNVPISIVAIGMGAPNADFFLREVRECVIGDMIVVRLGSCGGLRESLPVGSIVVPKASIAVNRNYDFHFSVSTNTSDEDAYYISKPVSADPELHLLNALESTRVPGNDAKVYGDIVNASADSSQGRQTSFPDHNNKLIESLLQRVEDLGSLEMETFHILHLAASWNQYHENMTLVNKEHHQPVTATDERADPDHVHKAPVFHTPTNIASNQKQPEVPIGNIPITKSRIRAASAQMIFAARISRDFITPETVIKTEEWVGKAALRALSQFASDIDDTLSPEGAVWKA